MASSLSSVPPVCPSARPTSIGAPTPQAATSGARQIEILSPTPPVECLSTLRPGTSASDRRSPESIIACVQARSSAGCMPRNRMAISSAATW